MQVIEKKGKKVSLRERLNHEPGGGLNDGTPSFNHPIRSRELRLPG